MSEKIQNTEIQDEQSSYFEFEDEAFRRGAQSSERLKLSLDRKVSPGGWYQESKRRWIPTVPNSFGLPAKITCPGHTEFCNDCYAINVENMSGVEKLLRDNYDLLRTANNVESKSALLSEMVDRYEREADRIGVTEKDKIFRIHWDGDFFSEDYADAWAMTITEFPNVKFWTYTRSFVDPLNIVPNLDGLANLTLYLSTDEYNVDVAHEIVSEFPSVKLALCAIDYKTGRELARGRRSAICPENIGRMALMDEGRGACVDCRWCPDSKIDVIFSTKHVEDADPQFSFFPESTSVELVKKRHVVAII
jgi:hypothetical protein